MLSTRKILVAATTFAFLAVGVCISFLLFGFYGSVSLSDTREVIDDRSDLAIRSQSPNQIQTSVSDPVSDPVEATPFTGEIALATGTVDKDRARRIPELIGSTENEFSEFNSYAGELACSDDANTANLSDAMIEDIESIRRQVGITALPGGVSPGGSNAEPLFRKALESIVESDSNRNMIPPHAGESIVTPSAPHTINLTPVAIAAQPESLPRSSTEEHDSVVSLILSLQHSVDHLSRRADELEQTNEYEAADRLRRLAKKLRKEIRLYSSAK